MADLGKLHEQRDRGARAESILNDPLVKDAFAKIEETIVTAWKESKAEDERGRYNAYLMHRLLQNFRSEFTRAISTGQAAAKELLRIEKESKLQKVLKHGRR